jgi:hypothetical protein
VTAALSHCRTEALAPVTAALAAMRLRHGASVVQGLVPGVVVADPAGWCPATELTTGPGIADFLTAAGRRWNASPHVAAALAWKCYTYWAALPAVLGWAAGRRVPLVASGAVLVRYSDRQPFLRTALHRPEIAVLPGDPLATAGVPGVRVVADEAALLAALREALVDRHLAPMLDGVVDRVRLGRRTLWGSLASGVAYALSRATDAIPGSTLDAATTLLPALGIADLVAVSPRAAGGLEITRRTCCLGFALAEPRVCDSCCLRS